MATQTRTQDEQETGNLIGFLNIRKAPGDKQPAFQGRINLPGDPAERSFALWTHPTKENPLDHILSGRAGLSANDQVRQFLPHEPVKEPPLEVAQKESGESLKIDAHSILLFTNKTKDAANMNRPDYWGYYNPGGGQPLQRIAAWNKTDRRGKAMLTGTVQPDLGKDAEHQAEMKDVTPPQKKRHRGHDHDDDHEHDD